MNKISKRLTKKDVLTVPNAMSLFRLMLIPVIMVLYIKYKYYVAAACAVAVSGATDIADGRIARKYDMVSDLGKFLDPLADKLTQAAIMICLLTKFKEIFVLICVFAVKELSQLLMGIAVFKRTDTVNSARWFGKVNTVILEVSMIVLILFPFIPETAAVWMIRVCIASVCTAFVLYFVFFFMLLTGKKTGEPARDAAAEESSQGSPEA